MDIRHYRPGPPLAQFVDLIWLSSGLAPSHAFERCLPSGTVELVINLREDRLRTYDRDCVERFDDHLGHLVCGPQSRYFVIDTDQSALVGVHFRPGGAYPFFRIPADTLRDRMVPLDALWGRSARRLRERLLEARNDRDRFHIVEQALLEEAARGPIGHRAVRFALRAIEATPHVRTISELTRQIGLSPRRFIQLFRQEVGLPPKVLCRILRFQRALHAIRDRRSIAWADIAVGAGYFDQAHFIHDFRDFSGLTPSAYRQRAGHHPNHVPLGME